MSLSPPPIPQTAERPARRCVPSRKDSGSRRPIRGQTEPIADTLKVLPTTRFYGSKRKLLPWIYSHIAPLKFDTAIDLFGGTASVALLLKSMGKNVVYHDGLRFNEDVGRTLLSDEVSISRSDLIAYLRSVKPQTGLISKWFDNIFYTRPENEWLDGFALQLQRTDLPTHQASLLRYLVYQACLRKRPFNLFHRANLYLRTNTGVQRSFGNFTTWEKSFDHHMLQAYDELLATPSRVNQDCRVFSAGNAEDIPAGYDLVYIDPPYISSEERYNWDNYWRRYHFLEGLARYHEWENLIDPESNVRLASPPEWITAWSKRKTFPGRLFSLINKHKNSIVVLSYVSGAHPDEEDIRKSFESFFVEFSVHATIHSPALSRSRKRELLFVGLPK